MDEVVFRFWPHAPDNRNVTSSSGQADASEIASGRDENEIRLIATKPSRCRTDRTEMKVAFERPGDSRESGILSTVEKFGVFASRNGDFPATLTESGADLNDPVFSPAPEWQRITEQKACDRAPPGRECPQRIAGCTGGDRGRPGRSVARVCRVRRFVLCRSQQSNRHDARSRGGARR